MTTIRPTLMLAAIALAAGLAPAAMAKPVPRKAPAPTARDWRTPDPQNILVIDTNKGRVIVELAPEAAPKHVERIQVLTRRGFYDGGTFFRVIDKFMDQTGDPTNKGDGGSDLPNLKAEFTWRRDPASGTFVTVARPTGADIGFLGSMPAIGQGADYAGMTSDHKVSTWGTYCPGVLGAARDEDNDSANSQFFLMRYAYPSLDKRYTAFGRVIWGMKAVRAIKVGEPVPDPQDRMIKVRLLADIPATERPKIKVIDTRGPWFKAEVARVRAREGADFSPCDIDIPVRVK
ncbi:MAG: peptidylprolyl isomerase [Caulobacter sp.]|nr:peptidylprolyl isomerase [Caulobacter sp.]